MISNKRLRNTLIVSVIIGVAFYFSGATLAGTFYFIFGNNAELDKLLETMGRIVLYVTLLGPLATYLLARRLKKEFTDTSQYKKFVLLNAFVTLLIPVIMIVLSRFETQ